MIELGLGVSFIRDIHKNEVDLKLIKPLRIKDLNLERSFYFVHNKEGLCLLQ